MYDVKDIKNYILYLKRECGLYITLHPHVDESLITMSELINFNIHEHPYCIYIKTFDNAYRHCIERQKKVREKCREGSFCGKCFAGVWEFVYPIKRNDQLLGFISVSGYQTENAKSFIVETSRTYHIPQTNLEETYSFLKKEIPDKKWVDTLVMPLCNMLELAYIKNDVDALDENNVINCVLRYMKRYYPQNITLEMICEHFGCSRSYLSHNFKKNIGQSFRECLTDLRLNNAESLLKYSELSITEIAYSVGFSESAYFSNVFKKKYGISPMTYRKKQKN